MHKRLIAQNDSDSLPQQFIYMLENRKYIFTNTEISTSQRKNYLLANSQFGFLNLIENSKTIHLYSLYLNDPQYPELLGSGLAKSIISYIWLKACSLEKKFIIHNTKNYLLLYLAHRLNPLATYKVYPKKGVPYLSSFQPQTWINQSRDIEISYFPPYPEKQHLEPPYQFDVQEHLVIPNQPVNQKICGISLHQFQFFDILF